MALANARGGRIGVGVSDRVPRQVVGVSWGQAQEEQVQEAARATQPPMSPQTSMLVVDGRTVAFDGVDPGNRRTATLAPTRQSGAECTTLEGVVPDRRSPMEGGQRPRGRSPAARALVTER